MPTTPSFICGRSYGTNKILCCQVISNSGPRLGGDLGFRYRTRVLSQPATVCGNHQAQCHEGGRGGSSTEEIHLLDGSQKIGYICTVTACQSWWNKDSSRSISRVGSLDVFLVVVPNYRWACVVKYILTLTFLALLVVELNCDAIY
jgi:hypothetical protein